MDSVEQELQRMVEEEIARRESTNSEVDRKAFLLANGYVEPSKEGVSGHYCQPPVKEDSEGLNWKCSCGKEFKPSPRLREMYRPDNPSTIGEKHYPWVPIDSHWKISARLPHRFMVAVHSTIAVISAAAALVALAFSPALFSLALMPAAAWYLFWSMHQSFKKIHLEVYYGWLVNKSDWR